MKKRFLAVVMATLVCASMLAGCGDDSATTTSNSEVVATVDKTAPVSDATFSDLQEAYGSLVEAYNSVVDLYNSDAIAGNAEIENLLKEAEGVITEMGEIDRANLTEGDAEELGNAMVDILEGLGALVDGMEVTGDASAPASAATIQELQDNFAVLSDTYDVVVNAYVNTQAIPQNDSVESALSTAADLINQIGNIETANLTEADAEDINDSMLSVLDLLNAIVDAM